MTINIKQLQDIQRNIHKVTVFLTCIIILLSCIINYLIHTFLFENMLLQFIVISYFSFSTFCRMGKHLTVDFGMCRDGKQTIVFGLLDLTPYYFHEYVWHVEDNFEMNDTIKMTIDQNTN